MRWHIHSTLSSPDSSTRRQELLESLYQRRQLNDPQAIHQFLHPPDPNSISLTTAGISPDSIQLTLARLQIARQSGETVVIYGDYDADGITATALLWEALYSQGIKAFPFIPHREDHGYGLSLEGLKEVIAKHQPNLIITVDNGIVAHDSAQYILDQGIDLIITDHHQPAKTLPPANAIVHSDQIAGSGVAWFLARELSHLDSNSFDPNRLLDLLAIGTIADLMPMVGVNRSLAKFGLETLTHTQRPGLIALKKEAGIEPDTHLSTYHVGYILGPRINAMGRISHGLDALRLLCTKNPQQATKLAHLLGDTNKTRQELTQVSLEQAENLFQSQSDADSSKVIIIDHEDFHEGVIGLIAGKLTEKYYRPAIVISRGETISKASCRSVSGINIIELIRTHQNLLINAGGHPGAAGFTINSDNILEFRQLLTATSQNKIDDALLVPGLDIDVKLDLSDLSLDLEQDLHSFEPFGLLNPRPVFSASVQLISANLVGRDQNHLKLTLASPQSNETFDAIGFRLGELFPNLSPGDSLEVAFTLSRNTWRGLTKLQLIIKDLSVSS